MISVIDIKMDTMVDGPGFRTSIYCAGCENHCPGCHNPQTWDINNGKLMSTKELMDIILSDPYANVTFTGGDPMFQVEGFTELAKSIKENTNKNIWCYTGLTFEELNPEQINLLRYIDVLVDGRFVKDLKDPDLIFRGSSNQRLIDVQQSLISDSVILFDINALTAL